MRNNTFTIYSDRKRLNMVENLITWETWIVPLVVFGFLMGFAVIDRYLYRRKIRRTI